MSSKYYTILVEGESRRVISEFTSSANLELKEKALLSLAYANTRQFEKAESIFLQLSKFELDTETTAFMKEAQLVKLINQKSLSNDLLLEKANEIISLFPDSFYALSLIGELLFIEGKVSEAINLFDQLLDKYSSSTLPYIIVVRHLLAHKEYSKARKYLKLIENPWLRIGYKLYIDFRHLILPGVVMAILLLIFFGYATLAFLLFVIVFYIGWLSRRFFIRFGDYVIPEYLTKLLRIVTIVMSLGLLFSLS